MIEKIHATLATGSPDIRTSSERKRPPLKTIPKVNAIVIKLAKVTAHPHSPSR